MREHYHRSAWAVARLYAARLLRCLPDLLFSRRTILVEADQEAGGGPQRGKPLNVEAIGEFSRHARDAIWIPSEPRWDRSLGSCDMQYYSNVHSRVEVV